MPHLITNDFQKAKLARGLAIEKQTQTVLDHIKQEQSHIVYLEEGIDPTDSIKQLGKPLTNVEFETRLLPLLPSSFVCIDNPFVLDKRAIVRLRNRNEINTGAYETICPYEKGILPEHSVMMLVTKEVPNPDIMSRKAKLSGRDLPKYEYKPGEGFVWDDTVVRPGYIRVKQVGRELKRGWRTVLLKLA